MKRLLAVVGGILLIGIGGGVLYLTFADLSGFRPRVEALVSEATGRELRIAGEFEPRVLPSPALLASDVTLANAEWSASMPMVSVGRLDVEVGLWSLVFGPIRIKSLALEDVAILLEQGESGTGNWVMAAENPQAEPATSRSGFEIPVVIESAAIENVNVLLRRPGREDVTAVLATLDVMTDDNGVTVASGMGQVGRLPVSFDATAGRRGEDNAPRVSIDASVADAVMHVAAVAVGSRIDIEGSVEDLERLGALFAAEGLPAAPLDLNGSVMLGGDTYELRNVVAKVAAAEARLDADIGRETIDMERLEIKVGPSDFVGSLRADLGEPLALVVKGESKLIDVTPPPTRDPQAAPASAQPAGEPTEPKSPWLFGEEELPFDRLGSASIDIELKIAELRRAELRAQDIVLALKGENAVFNLATTFVDPQGGSGEGTVELATADNSADLSIALDLKDLRLNLMSGEVDSPQQVPPIGVSVDIRSKGTSPRALAASSTGRVVFTQGAGRVDNNAVGLASSDILAQVFSALNPFAKDEEHSNWECTVLRLDLTDGVGVLTPMLAQAEKILIVGSGTVDLTTEKLDIEFNTKPRSGVGVTADMFVTPFVKVGGTLAEPGVSLNAGGTLLAGGMAILTGGASILVKGMADRATAEGDQCAGALAELDARLEPAREKTSGASQLGEGRR